MNFYLVPPNDYTKVHDADLEHLSDVIDYLKEYENIRIPNEFYEKKDTHGKLYSDFISEFMSDASRLFLSVMREQVSCEKSYQEIYDTEEMALVVFEENDCCEINPAICIYHTEKRTCNDRYIPSDITKAYRYYLEKNCSDYTDYSNRAASCFPDIVFHDKAFQKADKLGKFDGVAKELTRHLTALNDVAYLLYTQYGAEETLSRLQSQCHIYCSGKGRNEPHDYRIDMVYQEKTYTLNCQPHTKLFRKNTDQRIYFCWGLDEINKHAIIVVQIGDHFYQ